MKRDYKNSSSVKSILFVVSVLSFNLVCINSFAQKSNWVAPKETDNLKNPLAGNTSLLPDAKALYTANCAPCHGDKGRGDGPAASGLNPKPADHSSAGIQSESDGALFWKLSEGKTPMPGYKKIFTEQQRWDLINYIRTLQKGSKK